MTTLIWRSKSAWLSNALLGGVHGNNYMSNKLYTDPVQKSFQIRYQLDFLDSTCMLLGPKIKKVVHFISILEFRAVTVIYIEGLYKEAAIIIIVQP